MKTLIGVIVLSVLLFTNTTSAGINKSYPKANTFEAIELNRLIGLASDNEGLRISCAFNLGEMKSRNAVVPLIKILRESNSYEERIIAALSLIKIGDPQGAYMVGRVAKFTDDPKMKYFCEKFYNAFAHPSATSEIIVNHELTTIN